MLRPGWIAAGFSLLVGCAYLPDPPNYVHVVLYKMRGAYSAADVENFLADCKALLAQIPTLKGLHVGRPVPRPPRAGYTELADYQVGVVFLFDSQRGLQEFFDHPAFQTFEQKYAPKIEARAIHFSPYSGPPGL